MLWNTHNLSNKILFSRNPMQSFNTFGWSLSQLKINGTIYLSECMSAWILLCIRHKLHHEGLTNHILNTFKKNKKMHKFWKCFSYPFIKHWRCCKREIVVSMKYGILSYITLKVLYGSSTSLICHNCDLLPQFMYTHSGFSRTQCVFMFSVNSVNAILFINSESSITVQVSPF